MSARTIICIGAAAALLVPAAAVPAAQAAETQTVTFGHSSLGGSMTVMASDGFTEATIESLVVNYTGCGEEYETACSWRMQVSLGSQTAQHCNPSTPESQTIWDSGDQTESGTVAVGPLSFPLAGCPGQTLNVFYEDHHKFDPPPEERPWQVTGSGSAATIASVTFGPEPEAVATPNPPASPMPPFVPNQAPRPRPAFARGCRGLTIGSTSYAFILSGIRCQIAKKLVRRAYYSGAAPHGFHCRELAGDGRYCWRRGHRAKHFGWRLAS